MKNNNYIQVSRPHDSAFKHVSGFAEYTDDIKEPEGTLFGAIGWSKKANAIIKKIDLNEVKKSAGVISVVTFSDILEEMTLDQFLMEIQYSLKKK